MNTLAGRVAVDNLLILGLDSKKLVKIDRSGKLLSFVDLAGTTTQAIAGIIIDERVKSTSS